MSRKHLYIGCFGICCIVVISLYSLDAYRTNTLSASRFLAHLAGLSDVQSIDDTRSALLQHMPIGTPKADLIAYLRANNIEEDTFQGGQFMRYQVKDRERSVLVLLSDPPGRINIACNYFGYIIHLDLDVNDSLKDIIIQSTAVCL